MNIEALKISGSWWYTAFVGLAIALGLYLLVRYGAQLRRFCSETWVELKKCTWPWDPQQSGLKKYKELIDSTVVVVISTLILATYVASCDYVLVHLIGALTR